MTSNAILVVGDVKNWISRGFNLPEDASLIFEDYRSFTAKTLDRHNPELVLAPLTARNFDALDVAAKLQDFKFTGAFRVLTPKLPDMAMVRRELLSLAPDVDCDLVQFNSTPVPASTPRPGLKVVSS